MTSTLPCVNADSANHAKRPTIRSGPRSPWLCSTCRRALSKARRSTTATKRLGRVYGLSEDDLVALRAALPLNANGVPVCPGCLTATGAAKALCVDHDHRLERAGLPTRDTVRGILCGNCNQTIGRYGAAALRRLADYLDDPPAPKVLGTQVASRTPFT